MSHSSRLRMELLEDAVLRALARSEFLVSATLTRAHMEAAGWAVYVNEELVKLADSGAWEKLKTLIPKMLYGSAVAIEKHNLPPDAVLMPLVEPLSIMNAIDALDRFLATITGEKAGLREFSTPCYVIMHIRPSGVSAICLNPSPRTMSHG